MTGIAKAADRFNRRMPAIMFCGSHFSPINLQDCDKRFFSHKTKRTNGCYR